jgi:hypothetical protein
MNSARRWIWFSAERRVFQRPVRFSSYTSKSENLTLTFYAPTEVTKMLSRQATSETKPKSEYRNPKQTQRQINLKSGKSKTPNPNKACLEFNIFWSFEIVSNFGSFDMAQDRFRASNFSWRLCARHSFCDFFFIPKFQIFLARF